MSNSAWNWRVANLSVAAAHSARVLLTFVVSVHTTHDLDQTDLFCLPPVHWALPVPLGRRVSGSDVDPPVVVIGGDGCHVTRLREGSWEGFVTTVDVHTRVPEVGQHLEWGSGVVSTPVIY